VVISAPDLAVNVHKRMGTSRIGHAPRSVIDLTVLVTIAARRSAMSESLVVTVKRPVRYVLFFHIKSNRITKMKTNTL
jgi:hypothetical protein